MEAQKLLEYFLNWFISKSMYGIISVLDFDILGKTKGIDLILGLALFIAPFNMISSNKTTFQWIQGFLLLLL